MIFMQNHKNCSKELSPATMEAEGVSNISEYAGHLLDIVCYDGNLRNQVLVGIDGAFVNKTLHAFPEEEVRRAIRPLDHTTSTSSNPSTGICCIQSISHIHPEIC